MKLDDQRESTNIENRQGQRGVGFGGAGQQAGGMGGGIGKLAFAFLPFIFSKFGIFGVVLLLGGLFLFSSFGNMASTPGSAPQAQAPVPQARAPGPSGQADSLQADTNRFVAKILGSTEDSWGKFFAAQGQRYPAPTLVLFTGGVRSACGSASASSGPFYCPADRKVYLDTSFFDALSRRFGAPGDFAAAYVIAHEVGHHIQTITGISEQVNKAQRAAGSRGEANQALMRLELQADCLAGVWAADNRHLLDEGDFAEGVRAAQVIGDDTLQRSAGQRVVPDSFTHGSAEQRVRWLTRGFRSGDPDACDTFTIPASQL